MLKIENERTERKTSDNEVNIERPTIKDVAAKLRKIGDELNEEKVVNHVSSLEGLPLWKFMWFYAVIKSI